MQPKAPGNAFPADPGALGYGEIGPNNFNIPTTLISLQILGTAWYLVVHGQQRACMPVYIGKSGDLVG